MAAQARWLEGPSLTIGGIRYIGRMYPVGGAVRDAPAYSGAVGVARGILSDRRYKNQSVERRLQEHMARTLSPERFRAWSAARENEKNTWTEVQSAAEEVMARAGDIGKIADLAEAARDGDRDAAGRLRDVLEEGKLGDQVHAVVLALVNAITTHEEAVELAVFAATGHWRCNTTAAGMCEARTECPECGDDPCSCTFVGSDGEEWEAPSEGEADDSGGGGGGGGGEGAAAVPGADGEGAQPPPNEDEQSRASSDGAAQPSGSRDSGDAVSPYATSEVRPPLPPPKKPAGETGGGGKKPYGGAPSGGDLGPELGGEEEDDEQEGVGPNGGKEVAETKTVAKPQDSDGPPVPPPPKKEPKGGVRLKPPLTDPGSLPAIPQNPDGTFPVDREPPPQPPGVYILCLTSPARCAQAIEALNRGLVEAGLGWLRFRNDGGRLVLVDRRTGARVEPGDPRLRSAPAAATLVRAVNTPSVAMTMAIVDDSFRHASGEEATTSMSQPFATHGPLVAASSWPLTFYFNIQAYSDYRIAANRFIMTAFGGKDPLNPVVMLVNEIVEAEKVHEFRTTGRVTDAGGNKIFPTDRDAGDRLNIRDHQLAHRGDQEQNIEGAADRVSTDAEDAFRQNAGLPARAGGRFFEWPGARTEADGFLALNFSTATGESGWFYVLHWPNGGFRALWHGTHGVDKFNAEWARREREVQRRQSGGGDGR